jgi:hypothetical protein
MPKRDRRTRTNILSDRLHQLFMRYDRGELRSWINRGFERLMDSSAPDVERLWRAADGNLLPIDHCRQEIAHLHAQGKWPGKLTDPQWAAELGHSLRVYQEAKADIKRTLK